MKAIETVYRGYRFRSRLEARWAVFFDALGIAWEYEPEGFESGGQKWLPDFHLPRTNTWVEVKGSTAALREDWKRLAVMLDFGGVLPDFAESIGERTDGSVPGLLLLGPIPFDERRTLHPMVVHHKGLAILPVSFHAHEIRRCPEGFVEWAFLESSEDGWRVEPEFDRSARNDVLFAYAAARQARFEHGQVGAPSEWRR